MTNSQFTSQSSPTLALPKLLYIDGERNGTDAVSGSHKSSTSTADFVLEEQVANQNVHWEIDFYYIFYLIKIILLFVQ